jgi:DNA-binding CsgD family transcriptional regulator
MLFVQVTPPKRGHSMTAMTTLETFGSGAGPSTADIGTALRERFVEARRRTRGRLVCVGDDDLLPNAAASRVVEAQDHERLWAWARQLIFSGHASALVRLRDRELSARCEALYENGEIIGALIRIDADRRADTKTPVRLPSSFGWESLTEAELGVAQLVADGLTNREIGTRLFMSHHTVDSHLRQIFRKLEISSRIELTRIVVQRESAVA